MERLPPHNMEAEGAVLGSLLIDKFAVPLVQNILAAGDFYRKKHAWIYDVILATGEATDFLTVCDELERRGQLDEVGGPAFVTSLINAVPTSVHVEHYAQIVQRTSIQRKLIDAAGQIAGLAYQDDAEPYSLVADAEKVLSDATKSIPVNTTTIEEILSGFWDNIWDPKEIIGDRIFTGYAGIDSTTLGVEDSRFWVGAAVPSTGKSAFALNIVRGVVRTQKNVAVLYFHPEQSNREITSLLWSTGTPRPEDPSKYVPPFRIKVMQMSEEQRLRYVQAANFLQTSTAARTNGNVQEVARKKEEYLKRAIQDWEKMVLGESQTELGKSPIILYDPSGEDIHKVRAMVRRIRAKLPANVFLLVVFDGMHLIPGAGEKSRQQELATITRTFKLMAQKDVSPGAVWVNHQLNRSIYQQGQKRVYHYGLLRDSGTIEQDADVIYFLDRPSVWENGNHGGTWDPFDQICVKNRQMSNEFRSFYRMHASTMQVRGRDVV